MKLVLHFLALASLLGLSSCVQREVLYTETNWTTLEDSAWDKPAATGKKKSFFGKEKPKEKRRLDQIFDEATEAQETLSAAFAGEEIQGDVKRPAYSDKRFGSGTFDTQTFSERDKRSGSEKKPFAGMREFGRDAFAGVVVAPSSDRPAREGSQRSNLPKIFQTQTLDRPDGRGDAVTATPDDRRFLFRNGNRAAAEDSAALVQPRATYSPDGSGMSIDDVRKMLQPGDYREGS